MKTLFTLIVASIIAVNAYAATGAVITRLADNVDQLNEIDSDAGIDCVFGNFNSPAWAVPNWITGADSYSYNIGVPSYPDCACPLGFHVQDISFMMQFSVEDVPTQFDIGVSLAEMNWRMMPLPGTELCTGMVYTLSIESPGLYEFMIPIVEQCDCAYFDYPYFITVHFPTEFPELMRPDAITDNMPSEYISYRSTGDGWWELVREYGFPGELVMKANVACCGVPVKNEFKTWGNIKTFYR